MVGRVIGRAPAVTEHPTLAVCGVVVAPMVERQTCDMKMVIKLLDLKEQVCSDCWLFIKTLERESEPALDPFGYVKGLI